MRKRAVVAVAAVVALGLVAVAVVVGVRWYQDRGRSLLEEAMAGAPSASRYSWTDWAGVRAELGSDVDAGSDRAALDTFLDEGFDADLTSTTALVQSAPDLQRLWGFSPASVDWELYSQSTLGALIQLGMPDDYDFEALADRLRDLGYTAPSGDGEGDGELDGGTWEGGPDLVASVADVNPELAYLTLDEDAGVISASDVSRDVEGALGDPLGDDLSGSEPVDGEGLADVVGALGSPLTASVYSGEYACGALAMGQADAAAQDEASRLLAAAGPVDPLTGFAIGELPSGEVRIEMAFETEEQARTNADTRATLAAGPAPGQGGDFTDRFSVDSVTADGRTVSIEATPAEGAYVVSDLGSGPVLLAAC